MKSYVVACATGVILLTIQVSGQTAVRTDKQASRKTAVRPNKAVAAPAPSAKLGIQIPQFIAYQGKLTDSTGRPVNDGKYVMVFSLSADSTGSSFWNETQTVETRGGLFNVLLGSGTGIPLDSMQRGGCYLGIRVLPSAAEFSRQKIVSVPFAFQTDNSDKVQGKNLDGLDTLFVREGQPSSVTSVMIADGQVQTPDIADSAVTMGKLYPSGAKAGDVIKWTGHDWQPLPDSGTPAGLAGGDLTDTFPNPHLRSTGVDSGSYGSATKVAAFRVDSKGRLTAAADSSIHGVPPDGAPLAKDWIWVGNGAPGTAGTPGGAFAEAVPRKGAARQSLPASVAVAAPVAGDVTLSYGSGNAVVSIRDSAVTSAKILDGTILDGDISDSAKIAQAKVSNSARTIDADKVDGYNVALTGVGIIPRTNVAGKLDSSVVPGVSFADSVRMADMVDGHHAGNSAGQVAVNLSLIHI